MSSESSIKTENEFLDAKNDNECRYKCKFCEEILEYDIDSNELMHCQGCHKIWDGNAQCPCWMIYDI